MKSMEVWQPIIKENRDFDDFPCTQNRALPTDGSMSSVAREFAVSENNTFLLKISSSKKNKPSGLDIWSLKPIYFAFFPADKPVLENPEKKSLSILSSM